MRAGKLPPPTPEPPEGADRQALVDWAVRATGLNAELAGRLIGATADQLLEDARELAGIQAPPEPPPADFGSGVRSGRPEPPPPTMDGMLRAARQQARSDTERLALYYDDEAGRAARGKQ